MFFNNVLEERDSKYNGRLKVIKTLGYGTYIQSDGLTQSGGVVESIWKSILRRIKDKDITKILVLGLGAGTLAKLLRRKYPNSKIAGVEIDPLMIELGKKYFKLEDFKININVKDVINFKIDKYDLIIVDLYNGDKYPKEFETIKFLKSLRSSKLLVFNRLYYREKKQDALEFGEKLKKVFQKVETYYPTANVMFFCYNS